MYEVMLYRMACFAANRINEVNDVYSAVHKNKKYNVVVRTLRCLVLYGPVHMIREIKRELMK